MVYIPSKGVHTDHLLLVLMHINRREEGLKSLKIISDSTGTSSAILYDIPNQPLFDGKEEDDLQAYTFSRYIRSGDESWPLLFPMVKGAVRAMDAIQLIARKEKNVEVNKFVVAGHSKRGHTAWLTATADSRVKGIIPMAIDILNSTEQLPHHLEVFGEYNTPSKAATDLLRELEAPRGKTLINMVDPYAYRTHLGLPKLIVSATNDNFFATDALNLYWNGLQGPKYILYLSNADHVSAYSDPRINNTAFAFVRAIAAGRPLPEVTVTKKKLENGTSFKITTDQSAAKAVLWTSSSDTRDFRRALWSSRPMEYTGPKENARSDSASKTFEITIHTTGTGYTMVYGEVEFRDDTSRFLLTSQTFTCNGK
jgi:PhoPQ-activated pathogenicity-related protein